MSEDEGCMQKRSHTCQHTLSSLPCVPNIPITPFLSHSPGLMWWHSALMHLGMLSTSRAFNWTLVYAIIWPEHPACMCLLGLHILQSKAAEIFNACNKNREESLIFFKNLAPIYLFFFSEWDRKQMFSNERYIGTGILTCLGMGNKQDEPERKQRLLGDNPKWRATVRAAPSERRMHRKRREEGMLSIKKKFRKPLGKDLE